jgi:intracellular sulfur oxidation DsrE/DsrF family protein
MAHDLKQGTHRRKFLGSIASGAAAMGMATLMSPFNVQAAPIFSPEGPSDADEWFKKVKGRHRIVFDCTEPKSVYPFAWPKVFQLTNEATGTPSSDCGVVVVLRHEAIPYAMESRLWEKYKLGQVFKINDEATKAASIRNPFWKPKPGDFKVPGIGEVQIGINELQDNGVMFCVCAMAITVYSTVIAQGMNADSASVKADILSGILPGIQVVPSGVWAVGRAQEHGCGYCYV